MDEDTLCSFNQHVDTVVYFCPGVDAHISHRTSVLPERTMAGRSHTQGNRLKCVSI